MENHCWPVSIWMASIGASVLVAVMWLGACRRAECKLSAEHGAALAEYH
jgi:hypothetical protein